jgi:hypothetical protein
VRAQHFVLLNWIFAFTAYEALVVMATVQDPFIPQESGAQAVARSRSRVCGAGVNTGGADHQDLALQ